MNRYARRFSRLLSRCAFLLCAPALLAAPAGADPIVTTLCSFSTTVGSYPGPYTNANGAEPAGGLIRDSAGNLYGTTEDGGADGNGTVFEVSPAGTLTILYAFSATDSNGLNSDGVNPYGGLIQDSAGNLYGTTEDGGADGDGTVFKLSPSGTLTTLVTFDTANGAYPLAGLIQDSAGNLYGTTQQGGSANDGTVFEVSPAGAITTLYNFSAVDGNGINGDGAYPLAPLIQDSAGNLYGTTEDGGSANDGTVFKLSPTGMFTTLHTFSATGSDGTNTDGAEPAAGLVQDNAGNLYGTTQQGGGAGSGAVFKLSPSGTLIILHAFSATDSNGFNSDGVNPYGGLIQDGSGNLYGTTYEGGSANNGTAFELSPAGTLITLVTFDTANGAYPLAGLIQDSAGNLYGTTYQGGNANSGTVYRISGVPAFPPTITGISPASGPVGTTVTITGINFTGATLINFHDASTPNFTVVSPTEITVAVPYGAIMGAIKVTTPAGSFTGSQQFTVTDLPTITSFTPASGPTGTSVVITGTDFTSVTSVLFNGKAASTYAVNSATQITATVPSGTTSGPVKVTTSGGIAQSAASFMVIPAPTVTSFTPTSGPVGTVVMITGTNLQGVSAVRFHNASATVFSVNGAGTQITVTVPPNALTGTIMVTTPGGATATATQFTVTSSQPTVTSFTPASGPVGTVVTITGTNLQGTSAVRFHNASATVFSVNGVGTQITVTVPSGALTGTITVTTPGGSAQNPTQFTVTP